MSEHLISMLAPNGRRTTMRFVLAASACLAVACAHAPNQPARDGGRTAVRGAGAWWRSAVCYEVFVRSFADADGDGVGDLRGLASRLDYVNDGNPLTTTDLGANCLWLMPISKSPSYHGYDVTDYYHVDPEYGTDDDFRQLITRAHARGIRVLVDFVPNHSSSEHPYFQAALRDTTSVYRDWYRWSRVNPNQPGPWGQVAWHRSPVRDEYYYGVFWSGMPDLNYGSAAVRSEMQKVAAYWVRDMGADGLRLDAVPYLVEESNQLQHTAGTHQVLHELDAAVHAAAPAAFTVGEESDMSALATYYPDQLDSYFAFGVADATLDAAQKGIASGFLTAVRDAQVTFPAGRWAPFLTNHDQPRVMTRLAGNAAQARIAAIAMLTLPGTPFVYYGEEIGMRGDKPDEQIRTPMQWSAGTGAGFTLGRPWEDPQPDWRTTNVAAQEGDSASLLNLYRRLIHLRLDHAALRGGDLVLASANDNGAGAFVRHAPEETVLVVLNFSARNIDRLDVALNASDCGAGACRVQPLFGGTQAADVRVSAAGTAASVELRHLAAQQGYVFQILRP